MDQDTELLDRLDVEMEPEQAGAPLTHGVGPGWGRLELDADLVLHSWPRAERQLTETLREALAPSSRRRRPRPCEVPDAGILVLSAAAEGATAMLVAIRRCIATRLRPVAVVGEVPGGSELERLADAVLPRTAAGVRLGLTALVSLSERVDELPDAGHLSSAERSELDFLRFLATRDVEELAPVPDADSPIGYRQPLAEVLLGRTPDATLETLEEICGAGHLEASPNESIFLCGGCGSSRLSVREVCPGCRMPALVEEAVIHHFRCAFVGPSASFQRRGHLICPKCERELRHAGVDHDRPGADMRCQCCERRVVEGVAEARCLACDRRGELDAQRRVELPAYRPLPSLDGAALSDVSPLMTSRELLRTSLSTLEPSVHALLRARTEEVCRRYGRPASLMRVEVEDLARIEEDLGRRATRRRIQALARTVATVVRSTDLVSVDGKAAIEIVLVETDAGEAEAARRRLESALADADLVGLDVRVEIAPLFERAKA